MSSKEQRRLIHSQTYTYVVAIRQVGVSLIISQGYTSVCVWGRCVLPPWEASCPRSEWEADVWGSMSSGGPNLNLVDRPATWGELRRWMDMTWVCTVSKVTHLFNTPYWLYSELYIVDFIVSHLAGFEWNEIKSNKKENSMCYVNHIIPVAQWKCANSVIDGVSKPITEYIFSNVWFFLCQCP